MGFIIWYKVEVAEADGGGGLLGSVGSLLGLGLPLKVSNDVFSGSYILDADIELAMTSGARASTFRVTLINLPADLANTLKSKQAEGLRNKKPLQAKISLGYFEDAPALTSPDPVMIGAVMRIKSSVGENGLLRTEISGQELGGYALRTHCVSRGRKGKIVADDFLKQIASDAGVQVASGSALGLTINDFTLQADNALQALEQISRQAGSALVIRDNKIYVGPSVGAPPPAITFDPDTNIVKLDEAQETEETPEPCGRRQDGQVKAEPRTSFALTALGEPKLRVGQQVTVKGPDVPSGTLRTNQVTHRFSTSSGYTCDITVVVADPGKRAKTLTGADAIADRFRGVAESVQNGRISINVGQVTQYEPGAQKHLATLNYGQSPPDDAVTPSVDTPVDDDTQLFSKPIASPFAWQKCGLMVPVYPGMRALLAHDRGLVNDAVVAGFLWPNQPQQDRPQNQQGDYWLCLPTELGGPNNEPTGKGVNDLTDKSGLRIIQSKGLQIQVGANSLPDVGSRPTVPTDLANTIQIKHQSGTRITIDSNGAVTIDAGSKDISLTSGGVTLKLSGGSVQVS